MKVTNSAIFEYKTDHYGSGTVHAVSWAQAKSYALLALGKKYMPNAPKVWINQHEHTPVALYLDRNTVEEYHRLYVRQLKDKDLDAELLNRLSYLDKLVKEK